MQTFPPATRKFLPFLLDILVSIKASISGNNEENVTPVTLILL